MSNISTRSDNPYVTGYIIDYYEGDRSLERFKITYKPSAGDKLHIVTDSDTLWNLAYDNYGNSKYWWIIADVNDNIIEDPFILELNSQIIIPDFNSIKSTIL
jgi:nucleoid-associated protein YgaU